MKKIIVFALFLLFPSFGIMSQTSYNKLDKLHANPLNLTNHQNLSGNDNRFELQHSMSIKLPAGNHIKSVTADNQILDSVILESWDDQTVKKVISTTEELTNNTNINTVLKGNYGIEESSDKNVIYTKFKDVYAYDENLNVTSITRYYYDESIHKIFNQSKEDFIYDGNGNILMHIFSYWDDPKSIWDGSSKDEYTYNAYGRMTSHILSYWNQTDNKWGIAISKKEYAYDTNENLLMYIDYKWDAISSSFLVNTKDEYVFDTNRNMTSDIFSYRDEFSKTIVTYSKTEYTYDGNGKETRFDWFTFNQSTSGWDINNRAELTYNSQGNLVSEIDYNWDQSNTKGDPIYKKEYTFDANGKMIKYIDYQWTTNYYLAKLIEESKYDVSGNKVMDSISGPNIAPSRSTYYYSEHVPTVINNSNDNKINVYPNPATDYILFDVSSVGEEATIELFDIQGKMVLEQKLSENKQVLVGSLRGGQYLYKLNNSGNIYSGKIVVK